MTIQYRSKTIKDTSKTKEERDSSVLHVITKKDKMSNTCHMQKFSTVVWTVVHLSGIVVWNSNYVILFYARWTLSLSFYHTGKSGGHQACEQEADRTDSTSVVRAQTRKFSFQHRVFGLYGGFGCMFNFTISSASMFQKNLFSKFKLWKICIYLSLSTVYLLRLQTAPDLSIFLIYLYFCVELWSKI